VLLKKEKKGELYLSKMAFLKSIFGEGFLFVTFVNLLKKAISEKKLKLNCLIGQFLQSITKSF